MGELVWSYLGWETTNLQDIEWKMTKATRVSLIPAQIIMSYPPEQPTVVSLRSCWFPNLPLAQWYSAQSETII
jgi:hypothetical protein